MYDEKFLQETLRRTFEDPEYYNVPLGIRRHDFSNMHGWWVRVTREKTMFRKLFSDGVYGSIQEALKQAVLYRHEILSNLPPTKRKISNRGLPIAPEKRIKRYIEKGKLRPYIYWKARWYDKDHKIKTKNFPVHSLGESKAKSLALEAATLNHNKKPKISKVIDPYLNHKYDPISRADVEILATISSTPKSSNRSIANNNPFAYEGERKMELHRSIERDRKLRSKKIASFLEENNNKIFCELCSFNFIENYPFLSKNIIEVHHIIPLASLSEKTKINLNDLMLLCSNCHFAVHQGDAEENLLIAMDYFENKQQIHRN
jgi:predicted HNH restriction endonuclease